MATWLDTARALTGTLETPGGGSNPTIMGWPKEIAQRYPDMATYCGYYTTDETPWCGLFVAYCLAHNGIRPQFGATDTDKFLWARSWAQFGAPIQRGFEQPGDILVFEGHVGFYDGASGEYYLCRGGNQSDAVTVVHYPKATVWDIRRPPSPSSNLPDPPGVKKQVAITATTFGGNADPNYSAYDEHFITDQELGVALPYRFTGPRPKVRVWKGSSSVDCDIVDIGPWNTNDPYWQTNSRPQAESGTDLSGRPTNGAGIDLTPAADRAIGLNGKGQVDWAFIDQSVPSDPSTGSRKMDILWWVQRSIEVTITVVTGWFGGTWAMNAQAWFNIGVASTLVVMGLAMWWMAWQLRKMIKRDYTDGRYTPSRALPPTQPPLPPTQPPNNQQGTPAMDLRIFLPLLQQLLQGMLNAPGQPVNPPVQLPMVVPSPAPATPPSDGTMDTFLRNLLNAVLMAAATEIMKELPNLMKKAQS